MRLRVSPDGGKLYASTGRGGSVAVLDTASFNVVGNIKVGQRPWGIILSPDGKYLFAANGPSNDVSVIDAASRTVLKKIRVPGGPWGVLTLKQ